MEDNWEVVKYEEGIQVSVNYIKNGVSFCGWLISELAKTLFAVAIAYGIVLGLWHLGELDKNNQIKSSHWIGLFMALFNFRTMITQKSYSDYKELAMVLIYMSMVYITL